MTSFYICRHGETENNRAKRHQGWIDTPLTDLGIQNAVAAAHKLHGKPIDKIVSSDLGRAFVSAYIISKILRYNDEIERHPGFREVNYGDFANSPYEDFPQMTPEEYARFVFPNGESLEQMQARVLLQLGKVASQNDSKTVLIVAHDGTINAIRARHDQVDMATADQTRNPHDFVAHFTYANDIIQDFVVL